MFTCPDCGSRLVISRRVGKSERYRRTYLCGAVYHDRDRRKTTEVCSEIERLRAELDAAHETIKRRHDHD